MDHSFDEVEHIGGDSTSDLNLGLFLVYADVNFVDGDFGGEFLLKPFLYPNLNLQIDINIRNHSTYMSCSIRNKIPGCEIGFEVDGDIFHF